MPVDAVRCRCGGESGDSINYHFTFVARHWIYLHVRLCHSIVNSAFISPNRTFAYDRSALRTPHSICHSLPFSIIIPSLLFFIGRFIICLFRDFYLFSKLARFSKVPSALCWMPNDISLPEWEFRISFSSVFFFGFFNVPSGARTIEPKALNIIILSALIPHHTVDGLRRTHRIEIYTTISKSTRNALVVSSGGRGSIHLPSFVRPAPSIDSKDI